MKTYRTPRHNRYKSTRITSINLKLILQKRTQVLLHRKILPHRIRKSPSRSLSQPTHLQDLILTLEHPHLIEIRPQRSHLAVVNAFLELVGCRRGAVEVSMQT